MKASDVDSPLDPPTASQEGWRLGVGALLALGVHLLLLLALAWGVAWTSHEPESVQAELWAAVPSVAAPAPAPAPEPTPEPVRAPAPTPAPPKPKPLPTPPTPPTPQAPRKVDIAVEKTKKEAPPKKQQEPKKKDKEPAPVDQGAKARDKQKRAEEAQERKAKEQLAKTESSREQMLSRIQNQANTNTDLDAQTSGAPNAGPSPGYAGRIRSAIKPHIVFNNSTLEGNPETDVEVRLEQDGRIVSQRIIASSGSKEWDNAVLRAIERTEKLPLDEGKIPPVMVLTFKPKD